MSFKRKAILKKDLCKNLKTGASQIDVLQLYSAKREAFADSVLSYKFENTRAKTISGPNELKSPNACVLYWMNRDRRVQDNWAMVLAQRTALKYKVGLMVCYCLPKLYMSYTRRHFDFLINGLEYVHKELQQLSIPFHVLLGDPVTNVCEFIDKNRIEAVVTDFIPLDPWKSWLKCISSKISPDVSLFSVDAHNVIPSWVTSNKLEYSARTIRPKIHKNLEKYLTEFPPIISHEWNDSQTIFPEFKKDSYFDFTKFNADVEPVAWAKPGYEEGLCQLEKFVNERLKAFVGARNDAANNLTSDLSPWFNFGYLSCQRAILRVMEFSKKNKESVDVFVEEALVRRELSENYCYYTDIPESPTSAPSWARKTLELELKEKRAYIYNLEEFENCKTHDPLWNAAQNQMRITGKMSGYLRMYWAKKILEWCPSPETALKYALYLNDKYSIDGNDCNGIVGCMWSIYGLHDRPWARRPIFGTIRYMNETGCKSKFNVGSYIEKYGVK